MFSVFAESGTIFSIGKDRLLIGWGEKIFYPSQPKSNFPVFFSPNFFFTHPHPWFSHIHHAEIAVEEMIRLIGEENDNPSQIQWHNPYKDFFFENFSDLQQLFKSKTLTKAVPFVFEEADQAFLKPYFSTSLLSALKNLEKYPGTLYGTWSKGAGILGITPETLFTLKNERLHTHAIAGTSASKEDLFKTKIKNEHQWVIQGIQQSLQPFGELKIGSTEPIKLSRFFHLSTPIDLILKQPTSYLEIAQALHPTPALGTFPKKEGLEWLLAYQKTIDRHHFGAPIGFLREDDCGACYVAIRNIQWFPDKLLIGAGCGIVAESNPDDEWEEIKLKIDSIKEVLCL